MPIRLITAFLTLLSFAPLALADGKVSARGAVVPSSGQYYAGDTGAFEIEFETDAKKPPQSVALRYAFAGRGSDGENTDWANEDVVEMKAVSKNVWKAVFADPVAARGALRYTKLKFVFIVRNRPHQRHVQNGARSALGHYQVDVPFSDKEETELKVESIER